MRHDAPRVDPLPAEWELLAEHARWALGERDHARWLETGDVRGDLHMGMSAGAGGPGPYAYEVRGKYIERYRPSQEEIDEGERWHAYCREHGYPGAIGEEEEQERGYPPRPERIENGVWARVTWAKLRRHVLDGTLQEALF